MFIFNHLSHSKKILYFIGLLLIFVCFQTHTSFPKSGFWRTWIGTAYAHGGGGGGGGGGGDGGDGGDSCGGSSDGPTSPCANNETVAENQAPGAGGIDFEPHIVLAINADRSALKKARNAGLTIGQKIVLKNLGLVVTRLRVPKNVREKDICARLAKTGTNTQFDLNHYYGLADKPGRKRIRSYPNAMIGWPVDAVSCGSGARIGMVDTRIAANVPALQRQQIFTRSFAGATETSPADHGTDIATILVGEPGSAFPGLMPNARLYTANAFSIDQKASLHTTAVAIAQAMNWLISVKVHVINLSLTGPDNKLLKTTVQRTLARHIFLVAAAGNAGPGAPPVYPAAYNNVIAVTAVDRFLRPYHWANRGKYIIFAAPGVHIWLPGSDGRGQWRDGTSYASAFCTALVAQLVVRAGTPENTDTLIRLIRENSTDLGPAGKDDIFGWGLIHNWMRCNREKRHAFQD